MLVVSEMQEHECWALLAASKVGRLACIVQAGTPYVVPMSFVFEDRHIYGFSLIGRKIHAMRAHPRACLEVDEIQSELNWWSIVVLGRFEELSETDHWRNERSHAWSLLQKVRPNWWRPGEESPLGATGAAQPPHTFFRIVCEQITGRRGITG